MMSSSRIIKTEAAAEHAISDFLFDAFEEQLIAPVPISDDSGFVPLFAVNRAEDIPDENSEDNVDSVNGEEPEGVHETEELSQPGIAEEELNARVAESYERGFEEGRHQAEKGLSNVFKALRGALDEVAGLRGRIFRESENDILGLSIRIAGKIIQQEIMDDRRILARMIAAALESSSGRDETVIRLNPEDYGFVTSHRQLFLNSIGNCEDLAFKPDETVSPGGCIVNTETGEIDARLETQLDEIHKRLMEERGELAEFSTELLKNRGQYAYQQN
jgi:flagellar assembly protein FliH